jgi:hypothetical protein
VILFVVIDKKMSSFGRVKASRKNAAKARRGKL